MTPGSSTSPMFMTHRPGAADKCHAVLPQLLALQVCFQMLYTILFGWFATWVFCSSGRLAPAVAVHALCNLMGVPPFGAMAAHPAHGTLLLLCTAGGVAAFGALVWCAVKGCGSMYVGESVSELFK